MSPARISEMCITGAEPRTSEWYSLMPSLFFHIIT